MSHTHTGPNRLKGGLQPGWTLNHKTGTGQELGGVQAGYNDIGILTAPDGQELCGRGDDQADHDPAAGADDADEQCRRAR